MPEGEKKTAGNRLKAFLKELGEAPDETKDTESR
jgi:hypothetical protein